VLDAARAAGIASVVRRARSGGECLELLRAERPQAPALVLMDLNTPGVDGREALRAIRADPRLRTLPVVVFSTSAEPRDVAFCYGLGANAYHVKPLRYPDYLSLVRELFSYWMVHVVTPDPPVARMR
jgi:CheY-like chemotaxis protein